MCVKAQTNSWRSCMLSSGNLLWRSRSRHRCRQQIGRLTEHREDWIFPRDGSRHIGAWISTRDPGDYWNMLIELTRWFSSQPATLKQLIKFLPSHIRRLNNRSRGGHNCIRGSVLINRAANWHSGSLRILCWSGRWSRRRSRY